MEEAGSARLLMLADEAARSLHAAPRSARLFAHHGDAGARQRVLAAGADHPVRQVRRRRACCVAAQRHASAHAAAACPQRNGVRGAMLSRQHATAALAAFARRTATNAHAACGHRFAPGSPTRTCCQRVTRAARCSCAAAPSRRGSWWARQARGQGADLHDLSAQLTRPRRDDTQQLEPGVHHARRRAVLLRGGAVPEARGAHATRGDTRHTHGPRRRLSSAPREALTRSRRAAQVLDVDKTDARGNVTGDSLVRALVLRAVLRASAARCRSSHRLAPGR